MNNELYSIYKKLFSRFGPQNWWPAETCFEVMVGAILTQNTNWLNVEKVLNNLKKYKLLNPKKLYKISEGQLSKLIMPSGYYNIKAKRIKFFLDFLFTNYEGSIEKMFCVDTHVLRKQLLSVNGIGPETADSILLYALNKPVFVVDAYTKRILKRHKLLEDNVDYQQTQNLFMNDGIKIRDTVKLFNEYHALLVKIGKEFCLKKKPKCRLCPLDKVRN